MPRTGNFSRLKEAFAYLRVDVDILTEFHFRLSVIFLSLPCLRYEQHDDTKITRCFVCLLLRNKNHNKATFTGHTAPDTVTAFPVLYSTSNSACSRTNDSIIMENFINRILQSAYICLREPVCVELKTMFVPDAVWHDYFHPVNSVALLVAAFRHFICATIWNAYSGDEFSLNQPIEISVAISMVSSDSE